MQPHQERVVAEKTEVDASKATLDDRLTKLDAFIGGSIFTSLPEDERARLAYQANVMTDISRSMAQYSSVLDARIAAFDPVSSN